MQFRLRGVTTAELPCRTRLPFRFGAVTVTAAPLLHLRAEIETGHGRVGTGMASDLLVPKWFRKDVDRSAADDQEALRDSVRTAAGCYLEHGPMTCFDHWQQVHEARIESEPATTPDLLERGYGVALIERAMIDAICRLHAVPFATALDQGVLGRRFERPAAPLAQIQLRHTVGRLDPLRGDQIAAADRLDDGMPQALDEVLREHGVRWLKVKIGGGIDGDIERLIAIGALLDELCRPDVQVTLDGNEQIEDFDQLREVWRRTGEDAHGRAMLARVTWVEQPLLRSRSIDGRADWRECPLVLDEADAQQRTWRDSGYRGVSVKNCKGVFRALRNAERAASDPRLFQSSEDLTNLPVLAVQQDLCTAAALGLTHSERNGHHYFPGLDHLPAAVIDAVLQAHPELYQRTVGGARLRIDDGLLEVSSLQQPGYGCAQSVVDVLERELSWADA